MLTFALIVITKYSCHYSLTNAVPTYQVTCSLRCSNVHTRTALLLPPHRPLRPAVARCYRAVSGVGGGGVGEDEEEE